MLLITPSSLSFMKMINMRGPKTDPLWDGTPLGTGNVMLENGTGWDWDMLET